MSLWLRWETLKNNIVEKVATNVLLRWILSCTWGIIMTIIGAIATISIVCSGGKIGIYNGNIYCQCGEGYWGGLNLGPFFFVPYDCPESTKQHEWGHGIQNAIYGPFFIFLVAIPSFIRCQYYNIMSSKKQLPPYDSIWFEGEATQIGQTYCEVENA